jgi:DNA-binding NarL/FixJ family response regulator
MHRPRIILADDEPILLELIQGMLSERFDVVSTVEDGTALLQAAERDHPDVIVSNITMPGVNGFEAARRIRKRSPNLPIIFISAHTQHIYVEEAIKIGVAAVASIAARNSGDIASFVITSMCRVVELSPTLMRTSGAVENAIA